MERVPEDYDSILQVACSKLASGAEQVMWVTEMLGDTKFVMVSDTGFEITITKKGEECDGPCKIGE